jgi:hypothetical protein
LRIFEYSVLKRIFGPNKEEVMYWRKVHVAIYKICARHQIVLSSENQAERCERDMEQAQERKPRNTKFWSRNMKEGTTSETSTYIVVYKRGLN